MRAPAGPRILAGAALAAVSLGLAPSPQSTGARAGAITIDQPIQAVPMLVWTMVGSARGWERWFCDQARFIPGPPETAKPIGYEFRFAGLGATWRGSPF
jgi:hypothetical protein